MAGSTAVPLRRNLTALLLFAALAVLGQLVSAGPALGAASPITPPRFHARGLHPSPANPLRVWLLGDSVAHDGAPALTAALAATGEASVVADSTFGGWGLTIQHAWAAQSTQIIGDSHPQVIIGTWSWDNPDAAAHPGAYSALLRQAITTWTAPGNGVQLVVLVQFPPVGPNLFIEQAVKRLDYWIKVTAQQRAWDRIARSMTKVLAPRVVYFSTTQVFAPAGRFMTWMRIASRWQRVRQFDNVHLCVPGAVKFANTVVSDLGRILALNPPTPGWQQQSWVLDTRYRVGPFGDVACPRDAPPAHYRGTRLPGAPRGG